MNQQVYNQDKQYVNKLYSDFVKTSVRFITSNDLEILTVDYLMKKAEQNNQAQEELDLIEDLKVSRTQLQETMKKLKQFCLIESFELKLNKPIKQTMVPSNRDKMKMEDEKQHKNRICTFYRINNFIRQDTEKILEKIEKKIYSHYKQIKKQSKLVCTMCNESYDIDQIWWNGFICRKIECQSELKEVEISAENKCKIDEENKKVDKILQVLRNFCIKLKDYDWPFEQKNFEQIYQEQNDPNPQEKDLEYKQTQKSHIDIQNHIIRTEHVQSYKILLYKKFYERKIDLNINNMRNLRFELDQLSLESNIEDYDKKLQHRINEHFCALNNRKQFVNFTNEEYEKQFKIAQYY